MTAASGPTIGILGGGQLGRMLAMAAARLGVRTRCFDPASDACAGHVCELVVGEYSDAARLDRFAAGVDVVTFEFENVPVETAARLAERVPVFPPPSALAICQDRLEEKTLFRSLGIETAAFAAVNTWHEMDAAVDAIGLPAVLKTRRMGYDGKGQAVLRERADVERAWKLLGGGGGGSAPLILEAFVPFQRELSVIAARSRTGEVVFYPLTQNLHRGGILRESIAPPPHAPPAPHAPPHSRSAKLQAAAVKLAGDLIEKMDYVGVLAVELFELDGRLIANEMAPRVHNSGHWTIDAPPGAPASQFENHVRAILGWPLGGGTATDGHVAAMINLIGSAPPTAAMCAIPGARVHMYGKSPRPGRKIGHVNFAGTPAEVERGMADLRAMLGAQD